MLSPGDFLASVAEQIYCYKDGDKDTSDSDRRVRNVQRSKQVIFHFKLCVNRLSVSATR